MNAADTHGGPDVPQRSLDLAYAEDLVGLCQMTYDDMKVGDAYDGYTVAAVFRDSDTGTDAYLWLSQDHTVLAFRGTEKNREDILTDLRFRFNIDEDGDVVHRGFLRAWQSVEKDVRAQIAKLSTTRLTLTGHSLGGALATVAWSERWDGIDIEAYTFGAPRVAGKQFGRWTLKERPLWRFVYLHDFVPCVPLRTIGYTHHGDMVYLDGEGVEINPPVWEQTLRIGVAMTPGPWRWGHHKIARYAEAIEHVIENDAAGLLEELVDVEDLAAADTVSAPA